MSHVIDIAFSDSVKAIQSRKGSREMYQKMAEQADWPAALDAEVAEFIGSQTSAYLGTVSAEGQPYIQHRGGPRGFLHVLDKRTIAFADFKGNRQYISQGNLEDNPNAFMFLMDYSIPRRLKIWGEAKVIEGDDDLISKLMPENYKAKPEQVIIFNVNLWNFNCRQHLPARFDSEDAQKAIQQRDEKIAELQETIKALKGE